MHLIHTDGLDGAPTQTACTVAGRAELGERLYALELDAPGLAQDARPGQFVHIACGSQFLRRPISICEASGDRLRIVFQAKGEGTQWLSERKPGDPLDVLGPLGNGFDLSRLGERPVFVGGGIGVPPLLLAMRKAKEQGAEPSAILGFRSRSAAILEDEFRSLGAVSVTTDDGSYGVHGFVSDVLEGCADHATAVAACGPRGMLRAVASIAEAHGLPCQVSLEERMGCGIGACLVCACALKGEDGQTRYGHVCKDGPVFDAKEVDWT